MSTPRDAYGRPLDHQGYDLGPEETPEEATAQAYLDERWGDDAA